MTDKKTVLVLGSGVSGLLHVRLAKLRNSLVAATDVDPEKLRLAGKAGRGRPFAGRGGRSGAVAGRDRAQGRCGHPLHRGAAGRGTGLAERGKRRRVSCFSPCPIQKSVVIPINDFWTKEIRVLTSYYLGPPDIREAMELLASGRIEVDSLVTHRLPLERIAEGFALMLEGKEAVKIIIEPNGPSRNS